MEENIIDENVESKKPLKYGIYGGVLALIIGLIIVFAGYKISVDTKEKSKDYVSTEATIVDYVEKTDDDGDRLYAIVAQYTVEDDNEYKIQSKVYTSHPKKIGDKVKVKYNPKKPEEAIFEKDETSLILYFIGGVFAIVGLIITIVFTIVFKDKNAVVE